MNKGSIPPRRIRRPLSCIWRPALCPGARAAFVTRAIFLLPSARRRGSRRSIERGRAGYPEIIRGPWAGRGMGCLIVG